MRSGEHIDDALKVLARPSFEQQSERRRVVDGVAIEQRLHERRSTCTPLLIGHVAVFETDMFSVATETLPVGAEPCEIDIRHDLFIVDHEVATMLGRINEPHNAIVKRGCIADRQVDQREISTSVLATPHGVDVGIGAVDDVMIDECRLDGHHIRRLVRDRIEDVDAVQHMVDVVVVSVGGGVEVDQIRGDTVGNTAVGMGNILEPLG